MVGYFGSSGLMLQARGLSRSTFTASAACISRGDGRRSRIGATETFKTLLKSYLDFDCLQGSEVWALVFHGG